jgi:diguanylate cyclase (GGDEF)-like protein
MMIAERREVDIEALTAENEALTAMLVELRARIVQLEKLADADPLVPLPNRRAFYRATRQAIADVAEFGAPIALLFVDLDGLKVTNDNHGHQAGDALLRHVAGLLTIGLGKGDIAARLGGDEFGMLFRGCDQRKAKARAAALKAAVSQSSLFLGPCAVTPCISIGITDVREDDSPESAIARADAAMYAQRSDR